MSSSKKEPPSLSKLQDETIKYIVKIRKERKEKMNNKVYDVLKYVALIGLPAATVLYGVIGATLNIPFTQEVITIAVAVDTFLGALLGISTAQYNKTK